MGAGSDTDKVFGACEAVLFGSKVCHVPQCVISKAWCQGMCFMTWRVVETCLNEQELLGQCWTQLVQRVHYVSLESIPMKLSCQLAQISACSEPLAHAGRVG